MSASESMGKSDNGVSRFLRLLYRSSFWDHFVQPFFLNFRRLDDVSLLDFQQPVRASGKAEELPFKPASRRALNSCIILAAHSI